MQLKRMVNQHSANKLVYYVMLLMLLSSSCVSSKKSTEQRNQKAKNIALLKKYGELTGAPVDAANLVLYGFIDQWWGVPHQLGGMSSKGVDCSGFLYLLFGEVYGLVVPRTTDGLYKKAKFQPVSELKTGDLLFFELGTSGKVTHVGMYLQNGRFVHASTSKGVRIDDINDVYYRKQTIHGGSIR
jgi:cell wall-associated NlpC family hydrolase